MLSAYGRQLDMEFILLQQSQNLLVKPLGTSMEMFLEVTKEGFTRICARCFHLLPTQRRRYQKPI